MTPRYHRHADLRDGEIVGAHAAVEERADDDVIGAPRQRARIVLVQVMGAETSAAFAEHLVQRQREDRGVTGEHDSGFGRLD